MKLGKIIAWMDGVLKPSKFDDVSNNGLQLARSSDEISKVAFAVDGSLKSVKAAAASGAQLLVVHHGISWGGGIKRLTGGEYAVVKAALTADLALYASHLPLDANKLCGNNWEIARSLRLKSIKPAFSYHGNIIGVVGVDAKGRKIGVCSGGAGCFAPEAKAMGCDLFLTGEADWGEVIAAENVGMKMECRGHYETETFGVKALMREMKKHLKVATTFVSLLLCLNLFAEDSNLSNVSNLSNFYLGASGQLVLPQGGSKMRRLGGAAVQLGWHWTDNVAFEGEAAWLEDRCGLAARTVVHFAAWDEYDKLFGYSRFDPFFTVGIQGWINNGQVGPAFGLGALYYLTDHWALRGDATATLGLETDVEMIYALGLGVQYNF